MRFPTYRPRRLRRNENFRRLIRETKLSVDDLIIPLFIVPGTRVTNPVSSMPGIAQLSVDRAVEECKAIRDLGIPGVILFGIPDQKDAVGSMRITTTALSNGHYEPLKNRFPDCC